MLDPTPIMRAEREATMRTIERLPLSEEARADIYGLWQAVQEAINAYARREDRWIDEQVVPTTLRLMADEHERVLRRLKQVGP
jgi:hypothetical protein